MDDKIKKVLEDLDLEPIMVKAMDKEEGYGWVLNSHKEFKKSIENT